MNKQIRYGNTTIIVVFVIAVGILAAVGFLFWQNFIQQKANEKTSVVPSKIVKATPAAVTLGVADWGIKFIVPDGLKLTDVINYKAHVGEGPDYYGFTTNKVRAQGGLCDNQVSGNLSELDRFTTKTGNGGTYFNNGTLLNEKPINGYYYFLWSSVDSLDTAPACLQTDFAKADHQLLDKMLRTIEEDPVTSSSLQVPELGIKLINVPSGIKDLNYAVNVHHSDPSGWTDAQFSTWSLAGLDMNCSVMNTSSFGVLEKVVGTYNNNPHVGLAKQFNGFWIGRESPQVACSQDTNVQKAANAQMQLWFGLIDNPDNIQLLE